MSNSDDQSNQANDAAGIGENTGYYSQGRAATQAGGNRMAEGLQDVAGMSQSPKSTEEALLSTFDNATGPDTNQDTHATGETHDIPSGDQEGTYVGFADADTVPGNVEGWAGADNLGERDDVQESLGTVDTLKAGGEGPS